MHLDAKLLLLRLLLFYLLVMVADVGVVVVFDTGGSVVVVGFVQGGTAEGPRVFAGRAHFAMRTVVPSKSCLS